MSVTSPNQIPTTSREFLSPFALWDAPYLSNEMRTQAQSHLFYDTLAKVSWVAYLAITALITVSLGALNVRYLPAALFSLMHFYQPFMKATHHSYVKYAKDAQESEAIFQGILKELQALQSLPAAEFEAKVVKRREALPKEGTGICLSLLAQYRFFKKDLKKRDETIDKLQKELNRDESKLTELTGADKVAKEEVIRQKVKQIYQLEEQFYTQKVELAYLLHLIRNPFDRKRLAEYGRFERMKFSHFCIKHVREPGASPFRFHPKEKPPLSHRELKSWEIHQIHNAIFTLTESGTDSEREQ